MSDRGDFTDQASAHEAQMLADALAAQRRRAQPASGHSARTCIVCGEAISAARRKALPGVQTCIDCQARRERYGR